MLVLKKFKDISIVFLALILLFIACKIMLMGIGGGSSERKILLLAILIMVCSSSKKSFYFFIIPLAVIYSVYAPVGMFFGEISYQYIVSIFATDLNESFGFFKNIPIKNYFLAMLIIPCLILYYRIIKKLNINFYRNKTVLIIFIIVAMQGQIPFKFFVDTYSAFKKINHEKQLLNDLKSKNAWVGSSLADSKYDTYILVIGESVRRDYLHAYGYPIHNTPFMSSAKGKIVEGLTAAGTNTISSLRLMLTQAKNDQTPQYDKTFIDLANSAGIETHWISNQGYLGEFDTPITAIAQKSKYKNFLKTSGYDSFNTSDNLLLPEFKKALQSKNKKLIVLHLYGSHPLACDRVVDYPKIFKDIGSKYEELNCYISSIQQTDEFLEQVYKILVDQHNKDNSRFSMLYFADHGLITTLVDDKLHLSVGSMRPSFEIPLFKIDSDSVKKEKCTSFKSGFNFTKGIAGWIGITNPDIAPYSLFDCRDDTNQNNHKLLLNNSESDPAIDLLNFSKVETIKN